MSDDYQHAIERIRNTLKECAPMDLDGLVKVAIEGMRMAGMAARREQAVAMVLGEEPLSQKAGDERESYRRGMNLLLAIRDAMNQIGAAGLMRALGIELERPK